MNQKGCIDSILKILNFFPTDKIKLKHTPSLQILHVDPMGQHHKDYWSY